MRELVMVITDLYLGRDAATSAPALAMSAAAPGLSSIARFGERSALPDGWRAWLASWAGRSDLARVSPAWVAAAVLGPPPQPRSAEAGKDSCWIATPLELSAGPARVHLEHRGLLSLAPAAQALLCEDFARTFGGAMSLTALPCGEFLLRTPGIAPLATREPARSIGADIAAALPQGPASGSLRRLIAELEMWLHAHELNARRREQLLPPVTTLWPWGAAGAQLPAAPGPVADAPLALGSDAWLDGLWHLLGHASRELPAGLEALLQSAAARAVLVMRLGGELQDLSGDTLADALARLDARLLAPAVRALSAGTLTAIDVILNDVRMHLGRRSRLRLWRRARPPLAAFT